MLDDEDRKETLRERIAKENAFQLYKRYSEKHAADMIGCDYSTLKRKRRGGLVPFVDIGGGSVAYMGYHIADIIAFGVNAKHAELESQVLNDGIDTWPSTASETTKLATGGLGSAKNQPPTMASATTPPSEAMSAYRLARTILSGPRRS